MSISCAEKTVDLVADAPNQQKPDQTFHALVHVSSRNRLLIVADRAANQPQRAENGRFGTAAGFGWPNAPKGLGRACRAFYKGRLFSGRLAQNCVVLPRLTMNSHMNDKSELNRSLRVAVVGGGIGGIAAACCPCANEASRSPSSSRPRH